MSLADASCTASIVIGLSLWLLGVHEENPVMHHIIIITATLFKLHEPNDRVVVLVVIIFEYFLVVFRKMPFNTLSRFIGHPHEIVIGNVAAKSVTTGGLNIGRYEKLKWCAAALPIIA